MNSLTDELMNTHSWKNVKGKEYWNNNEINTWTYDIFECEKCKAMYMISNNERMFYPSAFHRASPFLFCDEVIMKMILE